MSLILDGKTIKELQPITELHAVDAGLKREFPFVATTAGEAEKWQASCREHLVELLGFIRQTPYVKPEPKLIEEIDRGDFIRRKILIRTSADSKMPVYLLLPKGAAAPLPVVLAYHGHGYGVKDIVGLWENGDERLVPDGYHADFAVELCRRGMIVAAPEIACFGERQNDFSSLTAGKVTKPTPTSCENNAAWAAMLGMSLLGMRVRDSLRLTDYLQSLNEIDGKRIGAMGISGGGMMTFFHAAADPRIKSSVVSGYFCGFRESILGVHHCPCNFVSGLLKLGDISDLAGLIAPRHLMIEAGDHDCIFPIDSVKAQYEKARRAYQVWGKEANLKIDVFEGRHRIEGNRAYQFLQESLQHDGKMQE
jgi:dienelactone hydrolase